MPMDNNDKPKAGKLWFRNEKTGEWSPVMQVESIECQINLTDEAEANLASLMVPLGDLEIVSKEE